MDLIDAIVKHLSIENISKHFKDFIKLYTSPLDTYKIIASSESASLNYTIQTVIYYCIFLFIISFDISIALRGIALELLLNLIAFLILLGPFKISDYFNLHKYKYDKLYRLLLIIKIQTVPPVLLLFLLAHDQQNSSLYNIFENLSWIIWIIIIIVPPLVFGNARLSKYLWILGNYIVFIFCFAFFSAVTSKFQSSENNNSKFSSLTPNFEYIDFESKYQQSDIILIDTLFLGIFEQSDSNKISITRTQFVTSDIYLSIIRKTLNELNGTLKSIDSLSRIIDIKNTVDIDSLSYGQKFNDNEIVSIHFLDSLRNITNIKFNSDIDLLKEYSEKSTYKRNITYFNSLVDYLHKYNATYTSTELMNELLNKSTLIESLEISKKQTLVLFRVDTDIYEPERSAYMAAKKRVENDYKSGSFIFRVLFKPLEFIIFNFL